MQYLDTTFYDRAVNWFLDQPFIAFIVLICVIIMAIPQLRDGIKILFQKKKKQDFTIKYAGETISFEEKCISRDFDIIKIKATTHDIGVAAEREWLKKKYLDMLTICRCYHTFRQKKEELFLTYYQLRSEKLKRIFILILLTSIKELAYLLLRLLLSMRNRRYKAYINNI